MEEEVVLEVGVFREASGANVALEGPRPWMHVHVRPEVSRSWEGFTAEAAFVWLILKQKRKHSLTDHIIGSINKSLIPQNRVSERSDSDKYIPVIDTGEKY